MAVNKENNLESKCTSGERWSPEGRALGDRVKEAKGLRSAD